MKMRVLAFVMLCLVGSVMAAEKPTLTIGVIAPITGDNGRLGEEARQAIDLALLHNTDSPLVFEVIYEDSKGEQKLVNAAARKLTSIDKVDAVITYWTPAGNLLGPICDKTKTIQMNTSWDPNVAKYKWTMVHGQSAKSFAGQTVEILKIYNCKRLAIAGMIHLGNKIFLDALRPMLEEAEIEVVFDEQVSPQLRDMRTYLLKIDQAKPDAALELWFHPQDGIFLRQKAELGLSWPATGYFDYVRKEDRQFIEGCIYPTELYNTPEFLEAFEEYTGKAPELRAGHTYDMINMFVEAAEAAYEGDGNAPSREKILENLIRPRQMKGLAIGEATMHENGWIESIHALRQIKEGESVPYP